MRSADVGSAAEERLAHVRVLLATHNGARWLDEQLQSIFEQAGVRVSVLVSDDGSTDQTPSLLTKWQELHPVALEQLSPTERKLGAAGNFFRLIREAPTDDIDFVALADQDDIWLQGRLANAVALMRNQDAVAYSSDVTAFWADGRKVTLGKASPQRDFDYLFEPAGPGCTYVLNSDLVRALQGELSTAPERFADIRYHDWLIYAFARSRRLRWLIDVEPSVLYRQHGHNELGANVGWRSARLRWDRLVSGWFRDQVVQIASLWPAAHADVLSKLIRFSVSDRLWLAAHAPRLRRRRRDAAALGILVLLRVLR